jgi:hypothetical protein
MNFDTPGYQEVVDNNLSYHEPFWISEQIRDYIAIRPYNAFIKVFEKNTREVYYTRCTLFNQNKLKEGFVCFTQNYIVNNIPALKSNRFRIVKKNNQYFLQLLYVDMNIPQFIYPYGELEGEKLEIVSEFQMKFYRPIGKVCKNIDNIFFQFESVVETSGYFEYDIFDLSNIDIKYELLNVRNHINNVESNEIKNKYMEKLDIIDDLITNDLLNILYSPYILKSIMVQFYNMEIIENLLK